MKTFFKNAYKTILCYSRLACGRAARLFCGTPTLLMKGSGKPSKGEQEADLKRKAAEQLFCKNKTIAFEELGDWMEWTVDSVQLVK